MEPATFAAPLAVQATPRRIPTTTLTAPVSGDRTRWRLLRALAGPTNLAPFHQPPNDTDAIGRLRHPRRHLAEGHA